MLSTLGKIFSRRHMEICFKENRFRHFMRIVSDGERSNPLFFFFFFFFFFLCVCVWGGSGGGVGTKNITHLIQPIFQGYWWPCDHRAGTKQKIPRKYHGHEAQPFRDTKRRRDEEKEGHNKRHIWNHRRANKNNCNREIAFEQSVGKLLQSHTQNKQYQNHPSKHST